MKRVERDPEGGWIARRRDGSEITEEGWRWNSRSAARDACATDDIFGPFDRAHVLSAFGISS